ncbi:MAG: alpha/beta fold hydrolase [Anaerolineae bacterium]
MLRFNRSFVILVLAALLAACAGPAAVPTATPVPPTATPVPPTATPVPPTPVLPTATPGKIETKKGEITSQALAGNLLGDPTTREFYVLLPSSYATSDKRYPVVYVLHGYMGHANALLGAFKSAYQIALSAGDLQEMIFVFSDANNRLGGSMYLSSPTIGDYETYITRELVDYIDANYRTIKNRVSRGITGCSMGGDGSIYLALKYPDVFSVAAPVSGTYYWERDPTWQRAIENFDKLPEDFYDIHTLGWEVEAYYALAAATASNPDKPPFYLDTPFAIVDGKTQIVPEVFDKVAASDPADEVDRFLAQPERLNAILILHGEGDNFVPVELARDFDQLLSDRGVEHEYLEKANGGHCDFLYTPVVNFMSAHLVGEEQP